MFFENICNLGVSCILTPWVGTYCSLAVVCTLASMRELLARQLDSQAWHPYNDELTFQYDL